MLYLRSIFSSLAPFLLLLLPPLPTLSLSFAVLLRPLSRWVRRSLLPFSEQTVILPEIATLADLPFLARGAMRHCEIIGSVAESNETNYVALFRCGTLKFFYNYK